MFLVAPLRFLHKSYKGISAFLYKIKVEIFVAFTPFAMAIAAPASARAVEPIPTPTPTPAPVIPLPFEYVQPVALDDRQFFPIIFLLTAILGLLLIPFLMSQYRNIFSGDLLD